ncbi:hypothetical protein [Rhizobium sp.]
MFRLALCVIAALALQPLAAHAVEDGDIIGQCLEDNADEGQTTQALSVYCSCANEKMMQDNYGKDIDISDWEKMNPDGQEACSKEAGWISQPD